MKRVRYSKYTGNLADELEMESLLEALSDFLLDSGFQSPYSRFQEMRGDQTLDNLREAMRQALEYGDLFDEAIQEKIDQLAGDGELEKLIEQLLDRMEQENLFSSIAVSRKRSRPVALLRAAERPVQRRRRHDSRSPTRAWIFSATKPCATCSVRWENLPSAGTIPGSFLLASKSAAVHACMSSAIR